MAEANPIQSDEESNLSEDSSGGDLEETSQLACSSCGQSLPQTDLYRCKGCVEESIQAGDPQRFCETCILIHIRRGHEVIDCKGYSPKVCHTHKNLCLMYCDDCQTVFCFKCLGPHCQHRFLPVSEKAREVRKKVFEYLNKFEQLSKSMAFRETDVRDVTKFNDELYGGLSKDNLTDFLCDKFVSVLRDNSSDWAKVPALDKKSLESEKTVNDVLSVSTTASSRVADLRKILTLSDGFCVSTFLKSKSVFDSSIEQQNSELGIHTARSWCNKLDNLMKFSIESSLRHWKMPVLYRQRVSEIEVTNALEPPMTNNFGHPSRRNTSNPGQPPTRNNVNPCAFYLTSPTQNNSTNKQTNSINAEQCRDCHANKISLKSSSYVCNGIFEMKTTRSAVSFCSLVPNNQQMINGKNIISWLIENYKVSNKSSSVLRCDNEVAFMDAHSRQMNFQNLEACKSPGQTLTQSPHAYDRSNACYANPYHAGSYQGGFRLPGHSQNNAANQTVKLPPNTEPVAYLGLMFVSNAQHHMLLLWNSRTKCLQFHPDLQKQFACESKPSSIHYLKYYDNGVNEDYLLAYAQLNGKVSMVDSKTGLAIEVGRPEHGLNQIDNLRFDKVQDKRKGCIVLFDYKQRFAVTCEFNLESILSLNFSIRSVCKFKVPASEEVQLMTMLNDNVVIVTDNCVYREEKPDDKKRSKCAPQREVDYGGYD